MKKYCFLFFCFLTKLVFAQTLAPLTVEKIMRDQKWIGTSPSNAWWSADGRYLFFNWNPTKAEDDSLYYITLSDRTPRKATTEIQQQVPAQN
ncbi:MAG TPA: hypothetical protein VFL47_06940, partial [Flavisolibacter sp.]|nr:hypothetical protein [Flavisolibacter sp.]